MAFTFPTYVSQLTQPIIGHNFTPNQSAQLAVTATTGAKTMTALHGGQTPVTYKITNTGTKGCYIAAGVGTATAVVSSSTATPASGNAISTCHYIGPAQTVTLDYPPLYDTIAAICGGSDVTTIEISIGYGQ